MIDMKHYEKGQDPYRYTIITGYILSCILTGMGLNPLSSISITAGKLYTRDQLWISLTTTIYSLSSLCFSLPAHAMNKRYGIKSNMIIGSLLMSVGFITRILINEDYRFMYVGQGISGAGSSCISCIQIQVIQEWFAMRDRHKWISITSLSLPYGMLLGYVISLYMVPLVSGQIDFDIQQRSVFYYLYLQAWIALIIFLFVSLTWRKSKQYLPIELINTASEDNRSLISNTSIRSELKNQDIWTEIKISQNKPSVTPSILLYGGFSGITTSNVLLSTSFIGCYSMKETWGYYISISCLFMGLVSSCMYLYNKRRAKHTIRYFYIMCVCTICLYAIHIVLMVYPSILILISISIILGISYPFVYIFIPLSFNTTSLLLGNIVRDITISMIVGICSVWMNDDNIFNGVICGYSISTASTILIYISYRYDHITRL